MKYEQKFVQRYQRKEKKIITKQLNPKKKGFRVNFRNLVFSQFSVFIYVNICEICIFFQKGVQFITVIKSIEIIILSALKLSVKSHTQTKRV